MPLSDPAPREPIHTRRVECRGYRRADGLWDIEAHLVDTKSYVFKNGWRGEIEPGVPVHEMWIRVTLDDAFIVHDAEAASDYVPFAPCPEAAPQFKRLKGLKIGTGWRRKVQEMFGGSQSCTHLVELLGPLATTAFQTIYPLRESREREAIARGPRPRPPIIDTCHALRSDGEVVKRFWPEFYTGP
ncbi:MAG TPA: DUF2889 domain-containing protein [Alphaproteobacteria bacterium]|nr:DUF2889 domain-containing protein [Alphaproteobacteria bacterium]